MKARFYPAALTLLPAVLTVYVWCKPLFDLLYGGLSAFIAVGILFLLADWARALGRGVESRLYAEWGGKPTTMWLRHRDNHLDQYTKDRYFKFFSKSVSGWKAPTAAQEAKNLADADARYESAVKWLIQHRYNTKKYPLVFKENITYGFRRNSRGVKPFAILIVSGAILFGAIGLWLLGANQAALRVIFEIGAIAGSLGLLCFWIFFVNDTSVRDAADAYARALLGTCDS